MYDQSAETPAPRRVVRRHVTARLPVAMAPLGLVFYTKSAHGSFAWGAGSRGADHRRGLGRPLLRQPLRPAEQCIRILRLTLLVSIALLSAMTAPAAHAPLVLAGLAALYGAVSSGIPGALRAALVSAVPEDLRAAALGLETVLNQSVWAVGPLIASWLSSAAPVGIILTMAASSLVPVTCARRSPRRAPHRAAGPGDDARRPRRVSFLVRALMLPLGIGVASNFVISVAEVGAPARLTELNVEAGFAGVLLAGFAVGSVLGGFLYGYVKPPVRAAQRCYVLLAALSAALLPAAVPGPTWQLVCAFCAAGLISGPLFTARNHALQNTADERDWGVAFSALYSASSLGYGLAGVATALLLGPLGAGYTLLLALCATMLVAAIAALKGRGSRTTVSAREPDVGRVL